MSALVAQAAASWVGWVTRRAVLVLVAAVLLTVAAGTLTVSRLGINTDTTDMLAATLPFRQNDRAFKAAFPQQVEPLVVVIDADTVERADRAGDAIAARLHAQPELFHGVYDPAGNPFFARTGLLYQGTDELAALTDRLAEAQPLLATLAADPSLRGLAAILERAADSDDERLDEVLARMTEVAAARAAGQQRRFSWRGLFDDAPPRRILVAQPALDYGGLAPAARAMAAVRQAAAELGDGGGLRVRLTGSAALATEELASAVAGAALAAGVSLLLVGLLLIWGLRSLRLVLATLVTLLAGLVWTAGFATLAIGSLNLISVAFAVLFIGLSVDFGIHYGLRFAETGDLSRAARDVGAPLTLSAVAAAAGFLAFVPTAFVGLAELGIISAVGMAVALLANLTLLPALLTVLRAQPKPPPTQHWPARAEDALHRHGRPVLLAALALAVAAAVLAPAARFDADVLALNDPNTESVQTFKDLLADSDTSPYRIEVLAPDLAAARALAAQLEPLPEVAAAVTLHSFVPSDQDAKLDILDTAALFLTPLLEPAAADPPPDAEARRAALTALRETAPELAAAIAANGTDAAALAAVEEALLGYLPNLLERLRTAFAATPVTLDDLPPELRARYLSEDGRARVEVLPAEDVGEPAARRRFVAAVQALAPDATGSPVIMQAAGDAVVAAMRTAATVATLVIAALLIALFGLRDALLVLAPLALAALLTVAASVLLGLPFNFANVIVLPLLLGLGVASGIHLVARARAERAGTALAATTTPRAVILSALTTIGSFGSLALSSHRGTASMGVLLTVAIGCTLVCALVVLPALLGWLQRRSRQPETGLSRP